MLENRVAVVTGGSRGIGEAIIGLFAKNRAIAVNGDISVKSEELTQRPDGVYEIRLDVSDKEQVRRAFGQIAKRLGRIDILVNNAGINNDLPAKIEETPSEEWEKIIKVNMFGVVNCTDVALPIMREKQYGRIINLASLAAEIGGLVSSIAYTASKGAILSTTKVVARLEGPNGITANCIAPGFIITEMTTTHQHNLSSVPLRRRGEAIDVANAALFLASDMGRYITGTTIDVNGGVYMK